MEALLMRVAQDPMYALQPMGPDAEVLDTVFELADARAGKFYDPEQANNENSYTSRPPMQEGTMPMRGGGGHRGGGGQWRPPHHNNRGGGGLPGRRLPSRPPPGGRGGFGGRRGWGGGARGGYRGRGY
eukprot:sb/3475336/